MENNNKKRTGIVIKDTYSKVNTSKDGPDSREKDGDGGRTWIERWRTCYGGHARLQQQSQSKSQDNMLIECSQPEAVLKRSRLEVFDTSFIRLREKITKKWSREPQLIWKVLVLVRRRWFSQNVQFTFRAAQNIISKQEIGQASLFQVFHTLHKNLNIYEVIT